MKKMFVAAASLTIFVLASCSSVVTPRIDERTGTTLEQRCVDYRTSLAALEEAGKTGGTEYTVLATWVTVNCPVIGPGEVITQ